MLSSSLLGLRTMNSCCSHCVSSTWQALHLTPGHREGGKLQVHVHGEGAVVEEPGGVGTVRQGEESQNSAVLRLQGWGESGRRRWTSVKGAETPRHPSANCALAPVPSSSSNGAPPLLWAVGTLPVLSPCLDPIHCFTVPCLTSLFCLP